MSRRDFQPGAYRLPPSPSTSRPPRAAPPRHLPGERFLKGPVPWVWLVQAGHLPGAALHVGVMLWHLAGLERSAEVSLSLTRMGEMGVSRHAAARGLTALERAGLVRADRHRGRKARVFILHPPPAEGDRQLVDGPTTL